MGMAAQAGDLWAGYLNYKTQQIRTAKENLNSANPYTRLRARSNLAQLGRKIEQLQQLPDHYSMERNGALQKELELNRSAWREAQQQLGQQQRAELVTGSPDNRKQLGDLYFDQSTEVGRNTVNTQGANFESLESAAAKGRGTTGKESTDHESTENAKLGQIQDEWFGEAGLGTVHDFRSGRSQRLIVTPGKPATRIDPTERLPGVAEMEMEGAGETSDFAEQDAFGRGQPPRPQIVTGDPVLQEEGRPESKLERFSNQLELRADADDVSALESRISGMEKQSPADGVPRPPSGAAIPPDSQSIVPSGRARDRQLGIAGQVPSDPAATKATGLASLDIEFPLRGTEYRFTTPGGDTNLLGRAVERSLLSRSMRLLAVTLVLALVGVLFPRVQRWSIDSVLNRGVCLLLIFAGLILLLLVPWIGLAALLIGSFQFAP